MTAFFAAATLSVKHFYSPADYIATILRQKLPGIRLSNEDIDRFTLDLIAANRIGARERLAAIGGGLVAKGLRVLGLHSFESFERRTITWFLLHSNYFELEYQDDKEFEYYGISEQVCSIANPFARFRE